MHKLRRVLSLFGVLGIAALLLSGCGATADTIEQAFNGVKATLTTYDQNGKLVDQVKGVSFRVATDEEFAQCDDDGTNCKNGSVILVSLGDRHMHLVGSTMILAEDGLNDITAKVPPEFRFENHDPGTPWLNDLLYKFENLWGGDSQTIMIRSQNGTPIKVYGGDEVQLNSTDVPQSTWFRVNGKTLFVYRADYMSVDNALYTPR